MEVCLILQPVRYPESEREKRRRQGGSVGVGPLHFPFPFQVRMRLRNRDWWNRNQTHGVECDWDEVVWNPARWTGEAFHDFAAGCDGWCVSTSEDVIV